MAESIDQTMWELQQMVYHLMVGTPDLKNKNCLRMWDGKEIIFCLPLICVLVKPLRKIFSGNDRRFDGEGMHRHSYHKRLGRGGRFFPEFK